jgi:hypothetical protein
MVQSAITYPWRRRVALVSLAALLAAARISPADQPSPPYSSASETPMIGIFYDLKQTPTHKPTGLDPSSFFKIVDEFLSKKWDESVLNRFYRVSKPLYATQIFIPSTNSDSAPAVFGIESSGVKPDLWLVHYKAQISPPEDGTYRFVGCGDDFLAVAVNGKTVLAVPLGDPNDIRLPLTKWKTSEAGGMAASGATLINGDWLTLKKDAVIDFDVIFGDNPGFIYDAYLMIEKKGAPYKRDAANHPILPIFQLAPYATPVPPARTLAPLFATGYPTWKSYQ